MKFQNPTIHRSKVNGRTHTQTDRQTDKPKAICPSNFFKVGGIIMAKVTEWFFYYFLIFKLVRVAKLKFPTFPQSKSIANCSGQP